MIHLPKLPPLWAFALLILCVTNFRAIANNHELNQDWLQVTDIGNSALTHGSTMTLPNAAVGNRSRPIYFAIRNDGATDLTNLEVSFVSGDTNAFQLTVNPAQTLAVGERTYFAVAFTPLAQGPQQVALEISSVDGQETPFRLSFSSEGLTTEATIVRGVRISSVVTSGMEAPDYVTGAQFTSFRDAPILGDPFGDRVLFRANVATGSSTRDCFWQFTHNASQLIRGIGWGDSVDYAPAGAVISTSSFSTVAYGPNANVAVNSTLQGGGLTASNNRAVLALRIGEPGSRAITRQGDSAGFSGWRLDSQVSSLSINSWGIVSFKSRFTGTGVNASNQDNIWTSNPSRPFVRQGWGNDSVPGFSSNVYYVAFGGMHGINSDGIAVFNASSYDRNTTNSDVRRLILRGAGQNRQITSAEFTPSGLASSYRFALSGSGPVKVTSGTNPWIVFADSPRVLGSSTSTSGVWRWRNGVMSAVIRNGSLVTLPEESQGLSLTPTITNFSVNSSAEVALVTNRGIVIAYPDETIELRYRLGDRLPGMPELTGITQFEPPTLSDAGRLAFVAQFSVEGVTRKGLWVETMSGLRMVAQTRAPLIGSMFEENLTEIDFFAGGHAAMISDNATAPTGWHPGNHANEVERLVFRTNDTSGRQVVWSADANAEFLPPALSVVDAEGILIDKMRGEVYFDEGEVGNALPLQTFSIKNLGEVELTDMIASIEGPHSGDFSAEILPATNDTYHILLHFTPKSYGARHAILSISSNDPAGAFNMVLQGYGNTPDIPTFSDLAASAGLTGDDALPDATPFNDGVENLLKFAFNMNLAGPDSHRMTPGGNSGLPGGGLVEENGQTYWRVEYVRRKNSGLNYTPQKSSTLGEGSFTTMTGAETVSEIPGDPDWERVIIDEPCDPASEDRCFSRVRVDLP